MKKYEKNKVHHLQKYYSEKERQDAIRARKREWYERNKIKLKKMQQEQEKYLLLEYEELYEKKENELS